MLNLSAIKNLTLIAIIFTFAATIYKIYDINNYILIDNQFSNVDKYPNCRIRNSNHNQTYFNFSGTLYPRMVPLTYDTTINFDCINRRQPKLILFWTKWLRNGQFNLNTQSCPVKNCVGTSEKMLLDKSDLVVFHMIFYPELDPLPKRPNYNQKWLFMLYESPMHTRLPKRFNGVFNLSATYKKSSNATSYYYKNFIWMENDKYNLNIDRLQEKTVFASIIVSNCKPFSNRLSYVREMQKYVQVKIYGKCGDPCPGDCKMNVAKVSMFYLAFENAICDDYITEKFFEILHFDVIPVVMGGGDYEWYVPKEGYINALDFNSPKELSEYLNCLTKNSTAYNSYFKWKKFVNFNYQNHFLCEICILAHLVDDTHSVIEDIEEFFSMKKDCVRNNDFLIKLSNLTVTNSNSTENTIKKF